MRAVLIALAAIAVVAATEPPPVMKLAVVYGLRKPGGVGGASCSDMGALDQTALHYWITGYFSGRNAAGAAAVGGRLGENALIGEVRNTCGERPAAPLTWAVQATYEKIQREQL